MAFLSQWENPFDLLVELEIHIFTRTMSAQDLLKKYYEAFQGKNWEVFRDCLSNEFTYFTDGCAVQDKTAFIKFLSGDVWISDSYEIYDERWIHSESGDMALCRYRTKFVGKDGENEIVLNAIESTTFLKESGDWKIIHSHTSNKM